MKKKIWISILTCGFLVISGFTGLASAQETEDKDMFTLEEITVTATKRQENLQKIPLSATSLVGETLTKTARTILQEMLRDTAGVEIRGTQQDQGIFIRGVGENTFGMGVETNVAVSINGVYATSTQANRMSQLDVARVEVVRGPDSTLNGRQAMGGSISIITNEPTHSFEGSGSFTAGNFDYYATQGVINAPIGEAFALRGAAAMIKRGGYLSNGGGDLDSFNGRLRAMYEPNDNLKLILTGEHVTTGGKGRGINSYTTPIDLSEPFTAPKGYYYNPTIAPAFEDVESNNFYLDFTYDFGWASLYFQPTIQRTSMWSASFNRGYDANSTDPEPDNWSLLEIAREQNQTTYEARLTSPDEGQALTWLGGFFYVDFEELQEFAMQPPRLPEQPALTYPGVDSTGHTLAPGENGFWVKDVAVYGTVTYDITDTMSLTVGGRYTKDEKERPGRPGSTYYYTLDDGLDNQTTGERVFFTVTPETAKTDRFDYKVSLQKDLTSDTMVYALVSTGFKGGGFNILPADPSIWNPGYSQFFDPEYLTSYEIGTKNELLGKKLRLNASAFYYDYDDMQLNFSGTPVKASTGVDPDWRRSVKQNVGKAVSMGYELEATYLLTSKDQLRLNIAYLNTEMKKTDVEPLKYLEGMDLPQSPKWRVSPSYRHMFNLAGNGEIQAEIDGSYVSDAMYTIPKETGDPYNEKEAYFKANATLSYFSPGGDWSLSCYVRNIFDKETIDSISLPRVYSGYSNVTFNAAMPRTYGLTLSAYF